MLIRKRKDNFRIQARAMVIGKPIISLEKGLNKVYEIKTYVTKYKDQMYPFCQIHLPFCFDGKKVKLVLVEDEK